MKLDHGVIGNGRVLALVAPSSSIDWLCMPRFDSPSVFARLLDEEKGGSFRIELVEDGTQASQSYVKNTNVLRTQLANDNDAVEIMDFAPRTPKDWIVEAPISITRLVRPIRGAPRIRVVFDPQLDYARGKTELLPTVRGLEVRGEDGSMLHLETNAPIDYLLGRRDFVVTSPIYFTLTYGRTPAGSTYAKVMHDLHLTIDGWQTWARSCALPLFAPDRVLRSALCLKLHAYEDTGAIIAATTTSVPEAMGTQRAWDYRYCWLRDAAFVTEALRRLSHLHEGERFLMFLRDIAEGGPLQPLYGIDGRRELPEKMLPHLAGFNGNGFVRTGNAAAYQHQSDLTGELVLCLDTMLEDSRILTGAKEPYFPLVRRLVEEAIEQAPREDTSIWEFRSILKHFTFSRAMCWAAVERGSKIAKHFGETDLAARWSAIADKEREVVLARGYNAKEGHFTQELDGHEADASLLLLPTIGLVDAKDPRFTSTVEQFRKKLCSKAGLLKRYVSHDDFGETTSAFTICSFWWAEALAMAGKLDEAIEVFDRVCKFANPVGLFSEDVESETGALLGNFPQAYTHVGLIHAAITIGELMAVRTGKVRAWT